METLDVTESPWTYYFMELVETVYNAETDCFITIYESGERNGLTGETRDVERSEVEGACGTFSNDEDDHSCSGGTDCNECGDEGENPFNVYDGSVFRKIIDLKVAGAARGSLNWTRYHNSVPRKGVSYFGAAGSWRHSWQYDLFEYKNASTNLSEILLVYPSGLQRGFQPKAGGGWAPPARFDETIVATGTGFEITSPDGSLLRFLRRSGAGRETNFELTSITDSQGLITNLEYNSQGLITRVVEPAGRTLTLTYRDVSFKKGVVKEVATIKSAPAADAWAEFLIPENFSGIPFRELRLHAYNKELEFSQVEVQFDDGSKKSLRPTGRLALLDLGDSGRTLGRVVRAKVPKGQEQLFKGCILEGTVLETASRSVLSRVEGGDTRFVEYDYSVIAEPGAGREFIALTAVRYGDGTRAQYKYGWPTPGVRPQLIECDDPRFTGRAKKIRYEFQRGSLGMIHHEINPVTGGVYASLELDKTDPDKRVVRYSDLRQIVYRTPKSTNGRPTEKIDGLGRKSTFEYADGGKGRLTARIFPGNRRAEIERDSKGRVTEVRRKGPNGDSASARHGNSKNVRDAKGRLAESTDRHGKSTQYKRDDKGRVTKISRNDGDRSFTYDSFGRITRFTQKDGGVHKFEYDAKGLKTSWTDSLGAVTRYQYDVYGRKNAEIDSIGRTTRFERNERGLLTKIIFPDSRSRSYGYDAYGRKTSETDEEGRESRFVHDELGRVIRAVDIRGGVTLYDYTELPQGCGSCTLSQSASSITHPDGTVTKFLYDAEGHLLARTEALGTAAQATTTFTYDNDGNVITVSDPLGRVTRYTYDDEGHRLSMTNAAGHAWLWAYDDDGNIVKEVVPGGGETTHEYDKQNRRIRTTDAAGNVTRFAYDKMGNLSEVVDALGQKTRHEYEGKRRTATTLNDGKRQTWSYDSAGRVVRTVSYDGLQTTYTYDAGDRVLTTSDSSGRKTAFTYDVKGHRLSATDPLGRVTRFAYDARGNLITTTRPDGVATRSSYDAQDRLTASTDPLGNVTRFTYDVANNLTSLTDARGNTYRFSYDSLKRKVAMVYPDGARETWSYDICGQIVNYISRAGQRKVIQYTLGGQILAESWLDTMAHGSSDEMPKLGMNTTYTYDVQGRLASLNNGEIELSYTYDILGRIASETTHIIAQYPYIQDHTVRYTYDGLGRRSKLEQPNGGHVAYTYDIRNRLRKIDDGLRGVQVASYNYDNHGQVTRLRRENGVETRYEFDSVGQLVAVEHAKGRTVIAVSRYNLDVLGRPMGQLREDNQLDSYSYDASGQLLGVKYGDQFLETEDFVYDVNGNRASHASSNLRGSHSRVYVSNTLNQYVEIDSVNYVYDRNGNLISDGKRAYRYDSNNRLVVVEESVGPLQGVRIEFVYDALDRCILRNCFRRDVRGNWLLNESESRILTYDTAWNLICERNAQGAEVGSYINGGRIGEILSATLASKRFCVLADGIGSAVALTDEQGDVVERYRYGAFGSPRFLSSTHQPRSSESGYRFLFTGREWLGEVMLSDHRHRYYDPSVGRWLTTDPIGFDGGDCNLYRYVHNSPVWKVDAYGLDISYPYEFKSDGFIQNRIAGTVRVYCNPDGTLGTAVSGVTSASWGVVGKLKIDSHEVNFGLGDSISMSVGPVISGKCVGGRAKFRFKITVNVTSASFFGGGSRVTEIPVAGEINCE